MAVAANMLQTYFSW